MIIIHRKKMYVDSLVTYKVILDRKVIGYIKNGESKEFKIKPGNHNIFLKVNWYRSNKIDFKYVPESNVSFISVSNITGLKRYFIIFYALFAPHKWIKLEKEN